MKSMMKNEVFSGPGVFDAVSGVLHHHETLRLAQGREDTRMSHLEITGLMLGGLLSVIFTAYLVLAESGAKKVRRSYNRPQKFAGGFSFLFGALMLGAWIFFVTTGREKLIRDYGFFVPHLALEFISSLALMLAGLAVFRELVRAPALLMTAYAIVIFTKIFSIAIYGSSGHPLMMNGVALILLVVVIYFVGLVYAWEHFVLHLDEPDAMSTHGPRVVGVKIKEVPGPAI
jgi:hypothetical protein